MSPYDTGRQFRSVLENWLRDFGDSFRGGAFAHQEMSPSTLLRRGVTAVPGMIRGVHDASRDLARAGKERARGFGTGFLRQPEPEIPYSLQVEDITPRVPPGVILGRGATEPPPSAASLAAARRAMSGGGDPYGEEMPDFGDVVGGASSTALAPRSAIGPEEWYGLPAVREGLGPKPGDPYGTATYGGRTFTLRRGGDYSSDPGGAPTLAPDLRPLQGPGLADEPALSRIPGDSIGAAARRRAMRGGGGGGFSPSPSMEDVAYKPASYYEELEKEAGAAENIARRDLTRAAIQRQIRDPYGIEARRALADLEEERFLGRERGRRGIEREYEQQAQKELEAAFAKIDQAESVALAKAANLPPDKRRAAEAELRAYAEAQRQRLERSFGLTTGRISTTMRAGGDI